MPEVYLTTKLLVQFILNTRDFNGVIWDCDGTYTHKIKLTIVKYDWLAIALF